MIAESLSVLDSVHLNFSQGGLLIMNITLAFIMFGVALDIDLSSFKNIILKPKSVIIGVISQFFLLPFVTYILVLVIHPTPAVALGMILVAACPGGNISNFISSLAKGNIELSVSLTGIATLGALFMTPLNFTFWGSLYVKSHPLLRPIEIDPVQIFQTILIILGIPLVIGILFSKKFPGLSAKIKNPIKVLSILIFMGYVVAALSLNFNHFLKYIHLIVFIVFAHNALALLSGFTISSIFKLPRKNRRSITIETGIQNSGLGLVLIFNPKLFPPDLELGGMAFIAAWWGVWHIIAGLGLAFIWSKKPIEE